MKRPSPLTTPFILALCLLSNWAQAQVRIKVVNPNQDSVQIVNLSSSQTIDISSWWICSNGAYEQLSDLIIANGSTNLGPGDQVSFVGVGSLSMTNADEFGIYRINSFGSSSAMEDYVQWGTTGNVRVPVAQGAGLWTAGDSVPYNGTGYLEFTGGPQDNGPGFWSVRTVTSRDERAQANDWTVFPVPAREALQFSLRGLNPGEAVSLQVLNLQGQAVMTRQLSGREASKLSLPVQELPTGVYISRVQTGEGYWTRRFNVVN